MRSPVLTLSDALMRLAVVKLPKDDVASAHHMGCVKDTVVRAIGALNPDFLSPFDWAYFNGGVTIGIALSKPHVDPPCWCGFK